MIKDINKKTKNERLTDLENRLDKNEKENKYWISKYHNIFGISIFAVLISIIALVFSFLALIDYSNFHSNKEAINKENNNTVISHENLACPHCESKDCEIYQVHNSWMFECNHCNLSIQFTDTENEMYELVLRMNE